MALEWIPNNGTQIERAIRALFISVSAATDDDCFISNESTERGTLESGITTILASQSSHDPEISGNEVWQVSIQNKFGAALESGEADTALNRFKLDMRVGYQQAALLEDSDDDTGLRSVAEAITTAGRGLAASEPDMDEFTCLFVRYTGSTRGRPDDGSCAWVEARNFEITACPSQIT